MVSKAAIDASANHWWVYLKLHGLASRSRLGACVYAGAESAHDSHAAAESSFASLSGPSTLLGSITD